MISPTLTDLDVHFLVEMKDMVICNKRSRLVVMMFLQRDNFILNWLSPAEMGALCGPSPVFQN